MYHHLWLICFFLFTYTNNYCQKTSTINSVPFIVEYHENSNLKSTQDFWHQSKLRSEDMHLIGRIDDIDQGYNLSYQQYYKGLKVDQAIFKLHFQNTDLKKYSGEAYYLNDLDIDPSVNKDKAIEYLTKYLKNKYQFIIDSSKDLLPELVIFVDKKTDSNMPYLSYKFEIESTSPLVRTDIYLDAHTGSILGDFSRIHLHSHFSKVLGLYNDTLNIESFESDSVYYLRQSAVETMSLYGSYDSAEAIEVKSIDPTFSEYKAAIQAHSGAEQSLLYFKNSHQRLSYDGKGSPIKSYVSFGNKFNNAFWDGRAIYYGDGDGYNFGPIVDFDITGHEVTHGVIDHTANLLYHGESGALNESFADIFGEMVEYQVRGVNDWILGARSALKELSLLRSMKDPKNNHQPDTYKGQFWHNMSCHSGNYMDYGCGIHVNSGVQNKWFYILAMGESGTNDLGDEYEIKGIGRESAAAIAYRSLSVYLSPRSMYKEARLASIHAAIDLFGVDSQEVIATTNAWYAVGVGEPYEHAIDTALAKPTIHHTDSFSDQLALQWGPIRHGVNYDVFLDSNNIASTTNNALIVDSLQSDTEYILFVAAYNDLDTLFSDTIVVRTLERMTMSPIYLKMDSIAENRAFLSWSTSDAFLTYQVFLNDKQYGTTSGKEFITGELDSKQVNEFWIIAENEKGQKAFSDTITIDIASAPKVEYSLIYESYFEHGWDKWSNSGSKAQWYQGDKSPEGWGSIRIKGGNSQEANVTSPNIVVRPLSRVKLTLSFYAWSMELGDALLIEYFNNDQWHSLDTLVSFYDFENNSIFRSEYFISVFDPGLKVRVTNLANASSDHVYLDEVFILQEEVIDRESFFTNYNISENLSDHPEIKLWPNPVNHDLHLSFEIEISQYVILNSLGNVLLHNISPEQKSIISTSNLPKGVYYLKVIYNGQSTIKPFVKM